MVICIFIDNKTTDGDLVNSRQQGANIFFKCVGTPMCKQDVITI